MGQSSTPLQLPTGLPSEVYTWGTPTEEFTVPRSKLIKNFIIGGLALIPSAGMLLLGLYMLLAILCTAIMADPPHALRLQSSNGWRGCFISLALGGALTGSIFWWLWQSVFNDRLRFFVCPAGFVRVHRKGVDAWRWEDIASVRHEMKTGSRRQSFVAPNTFVVRNRDGRDLTLRQIPRIRDLGEKIQHATMTHLYPPAQQKLDSIEIQLFGPVGVRSDGLGYNGKVLLWSDIKDVEVDKNGTLLVTGKGQWLSFAKVWGGEIPNIHVLLALIRHARAHRLDRKNSPQA